MLRHDRACGPDARRRDSLEAPNAKLCTAKCSVIVPAYNAEDTIEQAVRSALEQEPKPLEVIVADDGSSDGTAERAEMSGAKVLRLSHLNGSVARNRAVEAAGGDLLFFLDADDWWKPGKIAAHLAAWNLLPISGQSGGPAFVIDVATKVRPDGHVCGLLGAGAHGDLAWEEFLTWTNWTSGSSFSIFRSTYLDLGGFDESLIAQQDVDFWMRAAYRFGPAHRISRSYTCYRLSPKGVSKQPKDVEANLKRALSNWPFASDEQKREFYIQMTLTAAGFSRFPGCLRYLRMAGWPLWRAKFWRALARSVAAL